MSFNEKFVFPKPLKSQNAKMKKQYTKKEARKVLVKILQSAHAGERAAAFAYQGHCRTARNQEEVCDLQKIEREEWEHRFEVGEILKKLGEKPARRREVLMSCVGKLLRFGCRFGDWFMPMYFAGQLEAMNVKEYAEAAEAAQILGFSEFAADLRRMGNVEVDHENYFFGKIAAHRLTPYFAAVFGWARTPAMIHQHFK